MAWTSGAKELHGGEAPTDGSVTAVVGNESFSRIDRTRSYGSGVCQAPGTKMMVGFMTIAEVVVEKESAGDG